MPTYEYKCSECGLKIELEKRMSDPDPTDCTKCGGPVKQVISASGFTLKGRGWYETDYKYDQPFVKRYKGDGE